MPETDAKPPSGGFINVVGALGGLGGVAALIGVLAANHIPPFNQPEPSPTPKLPIAQMCPGQGFTDGCNIDGETLEIFRILDHPHNVLGIYVRNLGTRPLHFRAVAHCSVGGCNQVHDWIVQPVSNQEDSSEDQSFDISQSDDPDSLEWTAAVAQ